MSFNVMDIYIMLNLCVLYFYFIDLCYNLFLNLYEWLWLYTGHGIWTPLSSPKKGSEQCFRLVSHLIPNFVSSLSRTRPNKKILNLFFYNFVMKMSTYKKNIGCLFVSNKEISSILLLQYILYNIISWKFCYDHIFF